MTDMQQLGDIFKNLKTKKAPAHKWQDLALKIIEDLRVPNFKRNSIFKICKDNSESVVMQAYNDTKELCQSGQSWKYFLKIVGNINKEDKEKDEGKDTEKINN